MKRIIFRLLLSAVPVLLWSPADANYAYSPCPAQLCVPGDFPAPNGADFQMYLLAGNLYVDSGQPGSGIGGFAFNSLQAIAFHASPFSDPANTPAGTSTLTLQPISHYTIGTAAVFGYEAEFFIDGTGSGTLVDLDGTQGDWTLSLPLFALWNGNLFDFGPVDLGTASSYNYYQPGIGLSTLSGQSMDYQSGDAFLVGQAVVSDPQSPFNGIHVTLGINGNDPLVPAPIPGAAMLFVSGVAGLFAARGRRHRPQARAG